MQGGARNRDAFAGSTGEDQPDQQTIWRKADPGNGECHRETKLLPALLGPQIVANGLAHDEADASVVSIPHDGFSVRIKALKVAKTEAASQYTVGEVTVQLEPVIDKRH